VSNGCEAEAVYQGKLFSVRITLLSVLWCSMGGVIWRRDDSVEALINDAVDWSGAGGEAPGLGKTAGSHCGQSQPCQYRVVEKSLFTAS